VNANFHKFCKRIIDLIVSITFLALSAPLWIIVSMLIKLEDGGPVFFRRRVMGREGIQFDAFKFRTMIVDADNFFDQDHKLRQEFEKNFKLEKDPRVTRIGKILRKTSIDEFPQLINVILGQMSLIGPRIISPPEIIKYGDQVSKLLSVKPGCSGSWVVSGRQNIPYEQRVKIELTYIDNWSLGLDIKLLFMTVAVMFRKSGAY
jgi:lipopolysaccharide/colanic/teichoic acid biosynthesis glycosyltransferase